MFYYKSDLTMKYRLIKIIILWDNIQKGISILLANPIV